jgi:uncharacterized protein
MQNWITPLFGGLLIGTSVWLMLIGLGRVTGISGILATAMTNPTKSAWRFAFLVGLIGGGLIFSRIFNVSAHNVASAPWLMMAGLLVGFGTVLGNGCTSGHGVCGIGRLSIRSLVATIVFMASGIATVALIKILGTPL